MQLVVISPPVNAPGEHAVLRALFDRGLQTFHLRKPSFTPVQLREYLEAVPPQYLSRVVTHQHHGLARQLGLKGIHLPERDRRSGSVGRLPGLSLSTAIHRESVAELGSCGAFDWVFLSPIFDSVSKEGYRSAFPDRQQLRELVASSPCPVYALGGVTPDTLPEVQQLGFQGVAMLGSIWEAADPVSAWGAAAERCGKPCSAAGEAVGRVVRLRV